MVKARAMAIEMPIIIIPHPSADPNPSSQPSHTDRSVHAYRQSDECSAHNGVVVAGKHSSLAGLEDS
jgi:hypothetical protein